MTPADCAQIACVGIALAGTGISAITDLKKHKIRNAVTWPMICIGLLSTGVFYPGALPGRFLFMIACVCMSLIGVLGAGDAKLIMAVCALLGPTIAMLTTVAAGVLFFAAAMIHSKQAGKRAWLGVRMTLTGCIDHAKTREETGRPFAPWMFAGLVLVLVALWIF